MTEIDLTQFEGHTPGPWVIERASSGAINEIGPLLAEEYAGFAWLQVSNEDARLIAAAPDLLAAYKAALARAEAAEAEVKRLEALELARVNANERANRAERQRDEAFTAGAEAMREACAKVCDDEDQGLSYAGLDSNRRFMQMALDDAAKAIRVLPIPAQEGK